ncbi:MAG TPA: response regulator transcription factor [Acidimicrobiia bacterium]|nr:response regulator transcription factor [Acidimicrobiia bacterium]
MARVLIIDDEEAILRVLGTGLRARGYEVDTATAGAAGLSRAVIENPDVVVLDLGLPDLDGVEVCRRFRLWTEVPIVVLSAHGTEARKVEALDAGADDFVTKPFGMAELEARLRVALRHGARRAVAEEEPVVEVGPLRLDLARRSAEMRGQPVELTAREFDLVAFLARHAGKVVTHRMVLEKVWGPDSGDETHYLRVYANRLRRKLEDDPNHPTLLRTSPGVGYQLVVPEDP